MRRRDDESRGDHLAAPTGPPGSESGGGSRREPAGAGWDARPRACACCGRPLLGPARRVASAPGALEFCAPDCEVLYREYWLPRYGPPGAGA